MAIHANEPDRKALEELWRQRVNTARLRLEFARNYVAEVQQEVRQEGLPSADGAFAYRQAIRSEINALSEFRRVLKIFTELTVDGKIPDENDYRHAS